MEHTFPIAAASSVAKPHAPVAHSASPHSAVEAGRANLSLPTWARVSLEARLLLSLIAEQRPDQSKVTAELFDGTPVRFGYAGKHAARLRAIYDRTYCELIDWANAAPDRAGYEARRNAVIAYDKQFGADAIIAKVLGGAA